MGSNRNVYIGDCTTKALGVRPDYYDQNSGEQLLWENETLYSGTPISTTAATTTFGSSPFFNDPGLKSGAWDAIIVSGAGIGQYRKIVACSGTTITVSPAWNVPPDSTSIVTIGGVISHCVVYRNTLQGKDTYATNHTASTGIQAFGNSFDFIADSNSISKVRNGINLWGMSQDTTSPKSIMCTYFNYFANNTITHSYTGINANSTGGMPGQSSDPYPGISLLANVCTHNRVEAMTASGIDLQADVAPPGLQVDFNDFDHNTVTQAPVEYESVSSGHIGTTLSYRNTMAAQTSSSSKK